MSYEPEPLIVYERMFLFGASFLAAGAFVLDGHALLSGAHPTYAYVLYAATLCICLQVILRYFIVVRIFRTENNLWAWGLSMAVALLGPLLIHAALMGRSWFLLTSLFLLLGGLKTIQSQRAIERNPLLEKSQKAMLTRIQVGLFWFQSYLVIWMIGCWTATSATLGLWIAKHWFGVSNFELWRAGVTTFGGFVVLFLSAHLAVRVLAWHREYLSMFLARIDEVEVKVTKAENAGQPTRPEARHIGDSAVALKAPENIIKEEVQV